MASDRHDTHSGAQPHTPPPPAPPPAPPKDEKAAAAEKAALAAGSIGAQIILDYNGEGSLGARGGLAATIEENLAGRDAHLIGLGLDPAAPSGPPLSPEAVKAKEEAAKAVADAQAKAAEASAPTAGNATRVSSLAAGLATGDAPGAAPAKH